MNGKKWKAITALILFIMILATAGLLANNIYRQVDGAWRLYGLSILGAVILIYILLELRTLFYFIKTHKRNTRKASGKIASMLVLLNEEAAEIRTWDLQNQTGLVIGRSQDEADVDVDLSGTEFFSLISSQHAVLNYTSEGWKLMDVGSKNGTALLRKGSSKKLILAPGEPMPIRPGDKVYLAEETVLAVK